MILLLALFWFAPAYYAGEALLPTWGLECGLTSLITGLMGLAVLNRTEVGSRLFFEARVEDNQLGCLKVLVWFLLGFPVSLLLLGTLWWVMRLLGFWQLK